MGEDVDILVVGAGVIGLAIARTLALAGRGVLVIDRGEGVGVETSSRNSEVIHAGIYYPPGTLKAKFCVAGRPLLYDYCREHGVETRNTGKLIVAATDAEIPKLQSIVQTAEANDVHDLRWLSRDDIAALEPEVRGAKGLLSPSTGIVDSHGYMLALQGEAEAHGSQTVLGSRFVSARGAHPHFEVDISDASGETTTLTCRAIVNAAGHGAHAVASAIAGMDSAQLPPRFLAKGSYCSVSGQSAFTHLIYPVPVPGALGTHVTLDLAGNIRLGPNIDWVDELEYSVPEKIRAEFMTACQSYWPGVADRELTPSYCGIRPKIHGPDRAFADFAVQGPRDHRVEGVVNLFGIESPGLTSSLAIARRVADLVGA